MSASQREITLAPSEIIHPSVVNGRNLWLGSGVDELIYKLHYGDPTLGWEGDPRLALYLDDDCWVLERLEADDTYRTVCRSRPGVTLDNRLIVLLMEHDQRRGFDVEAVAEFRPFDAFTERDEAMREGLERVYHGAAKDLGEV